MTRTAARNAAGAGGAPSEVAIVGGGWAGIAAAVELAEQGRKVTLFEAASALGGRARGLRLEIAGVPLALDNGQHLLVGAYQETLALALRVGATQRLGTAQCVDPAGLVRHRMSLRSVDGLSLNPPRLPAPWHLAIGMITATGLTRSERIAIITAMLSLRMRRWGVLPGETVSGLLTRLRQPENIVRRFWEPLVLGALNTDIRQACARTFARVLRDTLGGSAAASDFLLPGRTLSEALPAPAARWLASHDVTLRTRTTIRALAHDGAHWQLTSDDDGFEAQAVVLAVPPWNAARLLAHTMSDPSFDVVSEALRGFVPMSIATTYLCWPALSCPAIPPWVMLDPHGDPAAPGQWLFDRGVQSGLRVAAVVSSLAGPATGSPSDLGAAVARQVTRQLALPAPIAFRTLVEKRATFACVADRPVIRAGLIAHALPSHPGSGPVSAAARTLALAGDYAYPDYPATIESAVRTGLAAARAFMSSLRGD